MEVLVGSVVRSLAGHDKGDYFIVLSMNGEYAYVADGKLRKAETPKKKKLKHLQKSGKIAVELKEKLDSNECVENFEVRKALAELVRTNQEDISLAQDDVLELEGKVVETLPNAMFKVELENGHQILAHISGKLRMNFIKILPGDRVKLEMSPYDLTRGRITWRSK